MSMVSRTEIFMNVQTIKSLLDKCRTAIIETRGLPPEDVGYVGYKTDHEHGDYITYEYVGEEFKIYVDDLIAQIDSRTSI